MLISNTALEVDDNGWTQMEANYPYEEYTDATCRARTDGYYDKVGKW